MENLGPFLTAVIAVVAVLYAILVLASDLLGLRGLVLDCLTSWPLALACVLFLVGLLLALHAHFEGHSRIWVVLWSLVATIAALRIILRPVRSSKR